MQELKKFIIQKINLDNFIKLLSLSILIIAIVWGYSKYILLPNDNNSRFVQIDLIKITNDYTSKAISLVMQLNQNVTPEQKRAKAQRIMQIVGSSLEQLMNEYSVSNHVIILQKQMIASDAGSPLLDITEQIENKIDSKLSKDQIINAAQQ